MGNAEVEKLGNRFRAAGASGRKAHIISKSGKWGVYREGSLKLDVVRDTKPEALQYARKMVIAGKSDKIVIHKTDGSVEKVQTPKL